MDRRAVLALLALVLIGLAFVVSGDTMRPRCTPSDMPMFIHGRAYTVSTCTHWSVTVVRGG